MQFTFANKKAELSQRWPNDARHRYKSGSNEPLRRYGHSHILGHMETPFKRAMVVSYRLSIVNVAISVTIRPQFAIECLRRSNQQGRGSLWAKISVCSPWSRPLMFAESEHPRLTNGEIISEEFQPMWSQSTNVTDRQIDTQTDDMRSQDDALH